MGQPFLGESESYVETQKRLTYDAVLAYYQAVENIRPYLEQGVPLDKLPALPERPEILNWLNKVEQWGLPLQGTFLDQPVLFLAQLEGAKEARDDARREAEQSTMPVAADIFATAPPIGALR